MCNVFIRKIDILLDSHYTGNKCLTCRKHIIMNIVKFPQFIQPFISKERKLLQILNPLVGWA